MAKELEPDSVLVVNFFHPSPKRTPKYMFAKSQKLFLTTKLQNGRLCKCKMYHISLIITEKYCTCDNKVMQQAFETIIFTEFAL